MKYRIKVTERGIEFESDHTRKRFQQEARERDWPRAEISFVTPESRKMRSFLHGSVIPMIVWHQHGMDHQSSKDCDAVFEWMKEEFGEWVTVAGRAKRVSASSRGRLREFTQRVIDWGMEQGYPMELCDPDGYRKWHDEIYSFGGPDSYLLYLESIRKLKRQS